MALSLKPLDPDHYPAGEFQIPLASEPCRVGREAGNELQVSHPSVSLKHALIEGSGTDGFEVVACGSQDAIFVNDLRVTERSPVSAGDLLRFGSVAFRVVAGPGSIGTAEATATEKTGPILPAEMTPSKKDLDPSPAEAFDLSDAADPLVAGVTVLKEERDDLLVRLEEKSGLLETTEAEIGALRGKNETLTTQLSEQEGIVFRLNRELQDGVQRAERLQAQLSEGRKALLDQEGRLAALNYEMTRRESSLRQLKAEHDQLQLAHDQFLAAHTLLKSEMEARGAALAAAVSAKEAADGTASGIIARLFQLRGRLLGEWRAWFSDGEILEESTDPELAFAGVEDVATRIRRELDLIEPIWHQFGEGVQEELRQRCDQLRAEERKLTARTKTRRLVLEEVEESLEQFRHIFDTEVRRAQGLSRRGTEIEIPERFESMVIARDHEQEIYRLLIERLEILDELIAGYQGSRKLKEVVTVLEEFRGGLATILKSSGVHSFDLPLRTKLTLRHRKEVQILIRKGWGTKPYTEYPFQPGEVTQVIRPGYRVGEGESAIILRKVEVLIRGVDE